MPVFYSVGVRQIATHVVDRFNAVSILCYIMLFQCSLVLLAQWRRFQGLGAGGARAGGGRLLGWDFITNNLAIQSEGR